MSKYEKMLVKLLRGASDNNFDFDSFQNLLVRLGFEERIKASHHIYSKIFIPKRELRRLSIFNLSKVKQNPTRLNR